MRRYRSVLRMITYWHDSYETGFIVTQLTIMVIFKWDYPWPRGPTNHSSCSLACSYEHYLCQYTIILVPGKFMDAYKFQVTMFLQSMTFIKTTTPWGNGEFLLIYFNYSTSLYGVGYFFVTLWFSFGSSIWKCHCALGFNHILWYEIYDMVW